MSFPTSWAAQTGISPGHPAPRPWCTRVDLLLFPPCFAHLRGAEHATPPVQTSNLYWWLSHHLSRRCHPAGNQLLHAHLLSGREGTSPLTSGVNFLPFALAIIPFGGLTGLFISKTGLYIPLHFAGFALSTIGVGLFSLLYQNSSTSAWVGFQIIVSGGTGIIFTATLPSTLAPLEESDVAVATGTYSFVRSFGLVWGVTLASIVLNGNFNSRLGQIGDESVRRLLADGAADPYASSSHGVHALQEGAKAEVTGVYVQALRIVWYAVVGVACLGFLVTFIEKHVDLRKESTNEFGLADEKTSTDGTREIKEGATAAPASTAWWRGDGAPGGWEVAMPQMLDDNSQWIERVPCHLFEKRESNTMAKFRGRRPTRQRHDAFVFLDTAVCQPRRDNGHDGIFVVGADFGNYVSVTPSARPALWTDLPSLVRTQHQLPGDNRISAGASIERRP